MPDPLGLIGGGNRVNLAGVTPRPMPATPVDPNAASFKDLLMKNIQQVSQLQQEAASAAEDVVSGKRQDVETVLTATEKADTAFRMLLAVKNKVMAAYDEIKQIRT